MDLWRYAPKGGRKLRRTVARLPVVADDAAPVLRAVIARGSPHAEIGGLRLVRATAEELDAMYT
jgi:hypothetical protein